MDTKSNTSCKIYNIFTKNYPSSELFACNLCVLKVEKIVTGNNNGSCFKKKIEA